MKFNLFQWSEVKANEETQVESGWLRVRSSVVGALYLSAQGVETLVSRGSSWDVETGEAVTFRVETEGPGRVFYHVPRNAVHRPDGEVFTNIDRMPHESGSLLEVRRALRELELAKRDTLRQIRAARQAASDAVQLVEPVAAEPAAAAE